jgi:hypothetical protein
MRRRHAAAALDDVPEPDRNRNGSARSFSSGNPIQQCDGNGDIARAGHELRVAQTNGCKRKGEMMQSIRIGGIPALLVLCAGIAVGQDASHDVDKVATKTGHVVKHATTKVGKATKRGAKDVGHGTRVAAKDTQKGVKTGTERTGEGINDAITK